MFGDFRDFIVDLAKKIMTSRIFGLGAIFFAMFCSLIVHLFQMQIINGDNYQQEYVSMAEKVIRTAGTRGNIYDRAGNILASNELAYNVSIQDVGAYSDSASMNSMLLRLVHILQKHGQKAQGNLELGVNDDGNVIFTSESENARKRFLRDYYGLKSVEELDDERGKYPSAVTAEELYRQLCDRYKLDKTLDENNQVWTPDVPTALQILDIRYTMRFTEFQKYETTTIALNVSDATVADILEHQPLLKGVSIEESTNRVYHESLYFAPIIGYTGKVTTERLEELKKTDSGYELNDIVGRTGIESSMELELKGTKGSETVYVDNMGRIQRVIDRTEPKAGNDVYLTLDLNLQKGIYNILERQLAGVLLGTIVNQEPGTIQYTDSSHIKIPVKDAYFQLINNNVLDEKHFFADDASSIEKKIAADYTTSRRRIDSEIREQLTGADPRPMNELSEEMQAYMNYIYTYLASDAVGIIHSSGIDTSSEEYGRWKNNTMSLRDYLYYGISANWIDTTKLNIESKYSDANAVFDALAEYVSKALADDRQFSKKVYRYLINNNVVTGQELMLAMYDQGVLSWDQGAVDSLRAGGNDTAYSLLMAKIRSIEITPAQLALDPCTASCVMTNVRTGQVQALVTYPSYDNNKINDISYFSKLNNDQSLPLRNNATQTLKAPGSTFKPISSIAGLEEHAISVDEQIDCTGIYDEIDTPVRCWIYPGKHGPLNVIGGIENSCNVFFSEVGHRLSLDENKNYNTATGISRIRKYAAMFGLDRVSGIEINESEPHISDTDPERSAIGQGTHQFTNVQLARYVTALANRGTVYDLSLIDHETDSNGNHIKDYTPTVSDQLKISDSTWNAVHMGMRQVIMNSSTNKIFADFPLAVAGKTGTAQESKKRGNHAFFVSFAPFDNPEVAVTVNIPNGYSSSNAAMAAKHVYSLYYGFTSLDDIMASGALDASNERINGD
ncbi:penicillin-binding transpeptidase domain-containing protein [[Clostridium] aminophilum]|uniref:penicillin-binding transpeptidase domain-containing protein n=1 Tax=[Clostridium] aminophilum TaxID=1526 RepID=UPI0026E9C8BE|nr:penicillin-binding transpeptidase domain-containing protein [[Clostridium] aminophilum]MDD6197155.1 penicillin-binding transpeptidase domain-containing protein [[Clostridium] aminophilum]